MMWKTDTDAGRSMWVGTDSIFNYRRARREDVRLAEWLLIGLGALMAPIALLSWFWEPAAIRDVLAPVFNFLAFGMLAAGVLMWRRPMPPKFLGGSWSLVGEDRRLVFTPEPEEFAGEPWSVSADEIASVEAGQTIQWQGVRHWTGLGWPSPYPMKIPDAEYQTFIMARDGRRLVVYTGNADREGASALAISLRSWVEAQRSGFTGRVPVGAPPPVSGPIAAAATAPAPSSTSADDEGFSL